ncbi:tetratricopeptide repeat protein [Rheinheimera marina]|uniref:Tetratricopeptide repeat protein n=1 Tax=Rheinheimera marina TaxID=1774958 RepID=A0ABV9JND5_9GAMM
MSFLQSEDGSEISQLELWLLTEAQWSDVALIEQARQQWQQLRALLPVQGSLMNRFDAVMQLFYQQALFTAPLQQLRLSHLPEPALIHHALLKREAEPLVLSLILIDMLLLSGLEVQPVWYQQQLVLQVRLSAAEKIWLDPVSGQWQCLLKPENGLVGTLADEMKQVPGSFSQLEQRLWQQQKKLFLLCGQKEKSLAIVQHLLSQKPDDPFLRRERALILELLDHWSLAIADYQYFVEQRPDDPLNEQIQQQIRQLSCYSQSLH